MRELRKETETKATFSDSDAACASIRNERTPKGDGNELS
mgnify:CR=1 FL=1